MLTSIDFAVIAAYFGGLAVFGLLVRRIRGFSDYAVGERTVPAAMIFASISAAYIGPGYTMGFASRGYSSGYLFFFVALGFTAQTLLVGRYLAPRLHRYDGCYTVGDIIAATHGRFAHLGAGIISFLLCVGFVGVMSKVGGLVVHATLGWPTWAGIILVTGVGLIYTFTGGIKSVIATEAVQFVVFALVLPVLVFASVLGSGVPLATITAVGFDGMRKSAESMGPVALIGILLSFLLGETLIPPYANRALASKSEHVARLGFVAAGGYSVVWFGMVVSLGVLGRVALPGTPPDDVFLALTTRFLPHGAIGLVVVAIAAIIMSSQESVLNAGAVSFTRDIWLVLKTDSSKDEQLRIARLMTLVVAVLASVVAYFSPSIIDALLIIYSLWAPSVLPVLVLGLVLRQPSRRAGAPALMAGALVSFAWQFLMKEPMGIPAILPGLAANLILYVIVSTTDRSRTAVVTVASTEAAR